MNEYSFLYLMPHTYFSHKWEKKDIGLLVKRCNRDNDGLGFDVFQVGLREHSHSLAAPVLGEDKCILTKTHGS